MEYFDVNTNPLLGVLATKWQVMLKIIDGLSTLRIVRELGGARMEKLLLAIVDDVLETKLRQLHSIADAVWPFAGMLGRRAKIIIVEFPPRWNNKILTVHLWWSSIHSSNGAPPGASFSLA